MAYKLSIIIPARNEEWLGRTIDSVLTNTGDETEVITVLDGQWPVEPIPPHPRLTMIHHAVSIGQRAAINEAARLSSADFVCKLDAHCKVDQDFGNKLIDKYEAGTVVVPRLYNLHVFDFICNRCGNRTYQGPKPTNCNACNDSPDFERVIVWQPRWNRRTDFMRFDDTLKFGYWGAFKDRPEAQGEIADTMSLLGACFFMSRKHYWDIDGSDEAHGSWGQQGTEISLKANLYKDGRLRVNKATWYSHLFRTQPGFGFPYALSHKQTEHARNYSRDFWTGNKWKKASRPLSSLLNQFWPIPGWTQESLDKQKASELGKKQFAPAQADDRKPQFVKSAPEPEGSLGICYYTENQCPQPIFSAVQKQLLRCANGNQLVSVSLKPIEFGDNVVLGLQKSYLTMFQQILAGLSLLDTDFVALAEHDVLYAPEHFQFRPPRRDVYYYNQNVWTVSARTGETLFRYRNSTSQLIADRCLLIDHYRERIARTEKEGFSFRNGFEPGTRSTRHSGYDDFKNSAWFSSRPNIDIRDHGKNLTKTLWKPEQFRNVKYTAGWQESDRVPGWPGISLGRFDEWLTKISPENNLE